MNAESKLDYSDVTSKEQAEKLFEEGKLEKILLFPQELGGEPVPQNVVYVPPGFSDIKDRVTGTLIRFVNEGLIDQLNVEPKYKGNSFVPAEINMRAWHSEKEGEFNPSIEIW